MLVKDYIEKHYGGHQAAFARACDTTPQQVTKWINKGYVVVDGQLFKPMRDVPRPIR